jgi:hypothetical protein
MVREEVGDIVNVVRAIAARQQIHLPQRVAFYLP